MIAPPHWLYAPKLAAAAGAAVALFAVIEAGGENFAAQFWRAGLTVVGTAFISTVVMLYRDQRERTADNAALVEKHHGDNVMRMEMLARRQERMFGVMLMLAMAVNKDGANQNLIEAIQKAILE